MDLTITSLILSSSRQIAIIHRINDIEDKWVVAPENKRYTTEEIENQVKFQEQYFEHTIELI